MINFAPLRAGCDAGALTCIQKNFFAEYRYTDTIRNYFNWTEKSIKSFMKK